VESDEDLLRGNPQVKGDGPPFLLHPPGGSSGTMSPGGRSSPPN
jgi:hypothetical protein